MVFENVGKTTDIYPSIGMRLTNESVRANFGSLPFKFAIEEHIRTQRDTVWRDIMDTSVDWSLLGLDSRRDDGRKAGSSKTLEKAMSDEESAREPLRKLVLAYLAHHGYARTARAFQAQCVARSRAAGDKTLVQPKPEPTDEDIKMAVDDAPAVASTPDPSSTSAVSADRDEDYGFDDDLNVRLSITNAILRGDIETAVTLLRAHHSPVLEREQGLVYFRLRCRKFVELVLAAGDALRRVKEAERAAAATPSSAPDHVPAPPVPALDGEDVVGPMDGVGAMDVDDPSPEAHPAPSTVSAPAATPTPGSVQSELAVAARASLHTALAYGQKLETEYKNDARPGVRAHLRRTFGVVAYDDPVSAGGEVAELAGQAARDALAAEVNQAILGACFSSSASICTSAC